MYEEPETMDDFERELNEVDPELAELERGLRVALARRPAPPDLKRKIVGRLWQDAGRSRHRMVWLERIAASLILVAVASGAAFWQRQQQQRRAEETRQQVFTALRIAGHALDEVNAQVTDRDQDQQ
jgi:hypothetical protein